MFTTKLFSLVFFHGTLICVRNKFNLRILVYDILWVYTQTSIAVWLEYHFTMYYLVTGNITAEEVAKKIKNQLPVSQDILLC